MPVEEAWGDRVIAARTKLGLTQVAFAQRLQISRETVINWELRRTRPYSPSAEWFARVEEQINRLTSEEAARWLGPDEYNETGGL